MDYEAIEDLLCEEVVSGFISGLLFEDKSRKYCWVFRKGEAQGRFKQEKQKLSNLFDKLFNFLLMDI